MSQARMATGMIIQDTITADAEGKLDVCISYVILILSIYIERLKIKGTK